MWNERGSLVSIHVDFPQRIEKVREAMRRDGVSAFVATRLQSISYLAGVFAPAPWRAGVLVPASGDVRLIGMGADLARMRHETWIEVVHEWDRSDPMSFVDAVQDALSACEVDSGRVAVEMKPPMVAGLMMVPEYLALRERFPKIEFTDGIDLLDAIMVIKEPGELHLIRRACEIADYGLMEAFGAVRVGVTENTVAGVAEAALRRAGSSWAWAETAGTEVGSGYRSAYPGGVCQPATNKLLQLGDTVVVDVHATYENYLSDTCGTAVVGKPTDAQMRLSEAWRAVAAEVVAGLRPGNVISDVARAALGKAEELGYLRATVPTFGHGLGTAVGGLAPFISVRSNEKLKPSTLVIVLTAMAVPGVGGMRLELPVLVTEDEPEVLGKFPVELVVAG